MSYLPSNEVFIINNIAYDYYTGTYGFTIYHSIDKDNLVLKIYSNSDTNNIICVSFLNFEQRKGGLV